MSDVVLDGTWIVEPSLKCLLIQVCKNIIEHFIHSFGVRVRLNSAKGLIETHQWHFESSLHSQ